MKEYKNLAKRDKKPLWEYLNLDKSFTYRMVNQAYFKLKDNEKNTKKKQLAWKILGDKFSCEEYKKNRSTERIFESGFFDDELEWGYFDKINFFWKRTPVYKIRKNLKNAGGQSKKSIVLLMTGAFSPIHAGHIIVMKTAKSELEKRGFCVIGGFLSPSHDEYVNLKDGGRAKLDAKYRVSLCKKAVKGSDWLMADGWESQHVTKPINYSVVYRRLKKYLAHKFPTNSQINVCLVVGGDNAAYSRIMSGHGYCVCIDRHNSNLRFKKILEEPGIKANRKIIMVSYKKEYLNYSSSSIRRGNLFMLENKSSEEYKKIKSQK